MVFSKCDSTLGIRLTLVLDKWPSGIDSYYRRCQVHGKSGYTINHEPWSEDILSGVQRWMLDLGLKDLRSLCC